MSSALLRPPSWLTGHQKPSSWWRLIPGNRGSKSKRVDHHPNLGPFPADIWLEIASQLEPSSTSSLILTCRSLAILLQPYLFQRIAFHQKAFPRKQHMQYKKQLKPRLEFLTSPTIRKGVRECKITMYVGGYRSERARLVKFIQWITRNRRREVTVLDTVMVPLREFSGLRKLQLKSVEMSSAYWDIVFQDLGLSSIELQSCGYSDVTDYPTEADREGADMQWTSSIREVICDIVNARGSTDSRILKRALTPSLQRLTLGLGNLSIFFELIPSSPTPFHELVYLSLPVEAMVDPSIAQALENCSSVTDFTLRCGNNNSKHEIKSLPPHILPNLINFSGPHCYATLFSAYPFDMISGTFFLHDIGI